MKQVLFAVILTMSAVSFAQHSKIKNDVREFSVSSVPAGQGQVSGTIKVDYAKSMMSVNVRIAPYCAPQTMCSHVQRLYKAELPIKSVNNDSCNIHTVTALQDKRPADGMLEKLTLKDVADITCKTLIAVSPEASLETSYVDRQNGKTITEITKMVLTLTKTKAQQVYPLLQYQASFGFSPTPGTLTLTIDNNGQVKSVRKFLGSAAKPDVKMDVGSLSEEALNNLKEQLGAITEDNILVDEREGQPQCVDAGSVEIQAIVDDVKVPVFRNSGCHIYRSTVWPATSVSELMLGFATLVK